MAVKSAERVLRILELLANYPDGLSNKEISEKLDYAASSTLGILQTLKDNGYLNYNERKVYSLGGKLVQLGQIAYSHIDLSGLIQPVLRQLMNDLGETCFLGIVAKDEIVYLAKANSHYTINTNATIGSRKPIFCTGLGKAFLAFSSEEKSKSLMDGIKFKQYTPHTVQNREELEKQIQQFREKGYAIDNEEIEEGLWCLAVPVYDGHGKMVAAISTSGPKDRMQKKTALIKEKMLEASRDLSNKLGYYKEEME